MVGPTPVCYPLKLHAFTTKFERSNCVYSRTEGVNKSVDGQVEILAGAHGSGELLSYPRLAMSEKDLTKRDMCYARGLLDSRNRRSLEGICVKK